jgi:hypothetical protein
MELKKKKCVTFEACWPYLSVTVFFPRILFSENLWSCVKYAVVYVQSNVEGNILQYSNLVECFFSSLQRDGIPLIDTAF